VGQIELIPSNAQPDGFLYQADFLSADEEVKLLRSIEALPFVAPSMRGVAAKRRTVHFGRSYDFDTFHLGEAAPIPDFLLPFQQRVATMAGCEPAEFAEALVTEYAPGAGIGWHRDAPPFGVIVGLSLLAACTMKFRRWPVQKQAGQRIKPLACVLEPRSAYVLDGEVRRAWQHHIPPIKELRYSITFRTLRTPRG
jgi:alkylated DNA repair protein (DNA oxidative demethylase)